MVSEILKRHWNAEKYKETAQRTCAEVLNLFKGLVVSGAERLLDIGCGDGFITAEIAKLLTHGHVVGIDITPNMITSAISEHCDQENLEFICMDAEKLQWDDLPLNEIVTSFYCMQWLKNKAAIFHKIKNILKRNGQVLMLTPAKHELVHNVLSAEMFSSKKWISYFSNYSDPTVSYDDIAYDQHAINAGLKVDEYNIKPVISYLSNIQALQDHLTAILPYPDHLPNQQLKVEFMMELVDRYLEAVPLDNEGRCKIEANFIVFRAHLPS